jgi:hypothetical protein
MLAQEVLRGQALALRVRLLHKIKHVNFKHSRFVRSMLLVQLCAAIACLSAV